MDGLNKSDLPIFLWSATWEHLNQLNDYRRRPYSLKEKALRWLELTFFLGAIPDPSSSPNYVTFDKDAGVVIATQVAMQKIVLQCL